MKIEGLYAYLAAHGVPDHDIVAHYGPCVTLLVISDDVTSSILIDALERQLSTTTSLAVVIGKPCSIPGLPPTLALRIDPAQQLLFLHHAIYLALPEQEVHLHYRPAYWQPHVKLANLRGDNVAVTTLIASVSAQRRPSNGMLGWIEVIRYPPAHTIWQAPLKADVADLTP